MMTSTSRDEGSQKLIEEASELLTISSGIAQKLTINIFAGDPIDLQTTRHTGFLLEYSDGAHLVIHVMGSYAFFQLEEIWNGPKPVHADGLIRGVTVGTWRTSEDDKHDLLAVIRNTPINNAERGWNCQNWIGDALQMLEAEGLLSHGAVQAAGDAMVDTILEAKDGE